MKKGDLVRKRYEKEMVGVVTDLRIRARNYMWEYLCRVDWFNGTNTLVCQTTVEVVKES
tara:strand:- start:325 stop:501 length:177 start_codon:yes stop_codon:yes gene_type:complete